MRYVFISDVHGQFDKMMIALDKFNCRPKADVLITLGDFFVFQAEDGILVLVRSRVLGYVYK